MNMMIIRIPYLKSAFFTSFSRFKNSNSASLGSAI